MADDLRSTLEASVAAAETAQAEGTPMPETVTPVLREPSQDNTPESKIPVEAPKPKVEETKPLESKTAEVAGKDTPKVTETRVEEHDDHEPRLDRAPQSWKPPQKAKWGKIDLDIRTEIVRREREATKVLNDSATSRKFVQGFQETVRPYAHRYQALGVSPQQAVQRLMHTDTTLATAPPGDRAKLMASLIKDYGIDINLLDEALTGVIRPSPNDEVERLLAEKLKPFQQFMSQTEQQRQAEEQRDFQRQQATVESMASDPKFPLFEIVREDMADIIEIQLKKGKTLPLDQVYSRAVQMNPEASAEVAKLSKQQQALKANADAQRALGASLSVSGNASTMNTPVPANDLRATIEAAVLAHSGR